MSRFIPEVGGPCEDHEPSQRRSFGNGLTVCLDCHHVFDYADRIITDTGAMLLIRRPLSQENLRRLQHALDQSIEETGTAIILKAPGVMTIAEQEQLRRLVEEWWDTKQEPEAIRG